MGSGYSKATTLGPAISDVAAEVEDIELPLNRRREWLVACQHVFDRFLRLGRGSFLLLSFLAMPEATLRLIDCAISVLLTRVVPLGSEQNMGLTHGFRSQLINALGEFLVL
ncbi:hypothetical protein [Rhizobium sp. Rhizsp42]|uniref:hypothetical protein n=1 Tax=Rhizobium sp. Rhizsp42 TaxID=3243034 RepID=UPI0039B021A6